MKFHLDNSGRSCFNNCPRKYYWQMERGVRPRKGSTALRYGTVWHTILESHYEGKSFEEIVWDAGKSWQEESMDQWFEDDYRTLTSAFDAYTLYKSHFEYDESSLKILHTERLFDISLGHIRDDVELRFTGKIDAEVEMDGMRWIFENKTTGQYMPTQANRLHRDPQIIGYSYAGQIQDTGIAGCIINLHHISGRKKKDGDYGTINIDFARVPNIFTEKDYEAWEESFIDTALNILRAQYSMSWPMHLEACYTYNKNCEYIPLCESHHDLVGDIPGDYYLRPWNMKVPGQNILAVENVIE